MTNAPKPKRITPDEDPVAEGFNAMVLAAGLDPAELYMEPDPVRAAWRPPVENIDEMRLRTSLQPGPVDFEDLEADHQMEKMPELKPHPKYSQEQLDAAAVSQAALAKALEEARTENVKKLRADARAAAVAKRVAKATAKAERTDTLEAAALFSELVDRLGLTQEAASGYLGLDKSAIHKKGVALRPIYHSELNLLQAAWRAVDQGKPDSVPAPMTTEKPKLAEAGLMAFESMKLRAARTLELREL